MIKILKDMIKTRELCGVYTDADDTSKFSVGYVLDCDETFFLLESIDQYGKADGVLCKPIEKVFNIEIKNEYITNIRRLLEYYGRQKYREIECGCGMTRSLLLFALKEKKVCAIELYESGNKNIIGFIKDAGDKIARVFLVTEAGKPDGEAFIEINRISHISCDSSDERKIELLSKLND
ncbi:MAG: hypothetical protein LBQ40_05730 [Clostridiales bacterium]|jgi:hypothetical protein|nr:hypothetical protein [Clostridiales bacterium]